MTDSPGKSSMDPEDNQMILRKNHQSVTSTFDRRNMKVRANENVQQAIRESGTDRGRRNLYESMKKKSHISNGERSKNSRGGGHNASGHYQPFSSHYKDEINQYLQPKTLVIEPHPIVVESN